MQPVAEGYHGTDTCSDKQKEMLIKNLAATHSMEALIKHVNRRRWFTHISKDLTIVLCSYIVILECFLSTCYKNEAIFNTLFVLLTRNEICIWWVHFHVFSSSNCFKWPLSLGFVYSRKRSMSLHVSVQRYVTKKIIIITFNKTVWKAIIRSEMPFCSTLFNITNYIVDKQ